MAAIKSKFNIPIGTNWHDIQFKTQIDSVNGLEEKLTEYLTEGDSVYFNQVGGKWVLKPSLFPDTILGQLLDGGTIDPDATITEIPSDLFYNAKVTLTNEAKAILALKTGYNLSDYSNYFITTNNEHNNGATFADGTSLYITYKDSDGFYFRASKDNSPNHLYPFLHKKWHKDDWCVSTAGSFVRIANNDAVTSVNNQTGHVCTYGGSAYSCTVFYPGNFYLFENNRADEKWYPQYNTTIEIPEPDNLGSLIAICTQYIDTSVTPLNWDTFSNGTLRKGNIETYFATTKRNYYTNTNFYLPYSVDHSNVIKTILTDFNEWYLDNKKYYDNALTASGYTNNNFLYDNTEVSSPSNKTKKNGGFAKGTFVLSAEQVADTINQPPGNWEDYNGHTTPPNVETQNSTINDYKFYIQFTEPLKDEHLIGRN